MSRQSTLDQIRRLLLFAAAAPLSRSSAALASSRLVPAVQLELPLLQPATPAPDPDLVDLSDNVHFLLIELILLIQMETADVVDSPLARRNRLRLGLGTEPPLRLLEEWGAPPISEPGDWTQGRPSRDREEAWRDALGRAGGYARAAGLEPNRIREVVRRLYPLASRATAGEDLAGVVAAHRRRHRLARNAAGRLLFRAEADRRRSGGAVYTPPEVAAELVRVLWEAAAPEALPAVCDPACGSGQFLLAAVERIAGHAGKAGQGGEVGPAGGAGRGGTPGGRANGESGAATPAGGTAREEARPEADEAVQRAASALRAIYGVDVDPLAVRLAAWNLSYWAASRVRDALRGAGERTPAQAGIRLDAALGPRFPWLLGSQLQTGNALQVEPSPFSPGFLWERRFPEVFERERPGFDLVTGNPPWVSHGLRAHAAAPQEERDYYERLFPAGTQYKLTLYPIFMELALRLCRAGGAHGFLVPDSVLAGHYFSRIRRLLVESADLLELTLLEGTLWPGVHVGHTLLYAVRKRGGGARPVTVRNRILAVAGGRLSPPDERTEVRVPSAAYTAGGGAPLRIYRDEAEVEFLARMQASPFRLKDVAWTYSGLIARHGQKSVQAAEPQPQFLLHDARGRAVWQDLAASEHWRRALLSGAEVVPFHVRWRGAHLYWPEPRERLPRVYKSGFDAARYDAPKVFLRQTGDRLIAAVDRSGLLCLNNLHLVGPHPRPGIPPAALAALLMSEPMQQVYRISSLEASRPLAQVDLKTVEGLPWPSDSGGVPAGAAPLPPRSQPSVRRALRRIERGLASPESGLLLELAEAAWSAPGEPWDGTDLPGRALLSLLLVELAAALEVDAAALASAAASRPASVSASVSASASASVSASVPSSSVPASISASAFPAASAAASAAASSPASPSAAAASPARSARSERRPGSRAGSPESVRRKLLDEIASMLFQVGSTRVE